ncbi:hypothetical protein SLITO_v1c01690 [Spiroplasma litorale]|uniref:Uncharacterized protein n=1 Tax=Spiroplasma litorale TaxID=216942 RepID=A0A0K1W0K0_9MOLU|nr:hypothetical protein [Spiroplasma litorale]AKX33835.1 hypothetical protein SLITO_v1c01690 [Spiroplasma litorale]
MKFRKIDNTEWIKNFFVDSEYLYLTNSQFNKKNFIGRIKLKTLYENLKIKSDIERYFLSNPNPYEYNGVQGANSDIDIFLNNQLFIQNIFLLNNVQYVTFLDDDKKIYTKPLYEDSDNKNIIDCLFYTKFKNDYIFKKNNSIYFYNENKKFDFDFVNIIPFNNIFIVQKENENIVVYSEDLTFLYEIDNSFCFKKIFYINKKNILISYRDEGVTYIYNVESKSKIIFCNYFIINAKLINENLIIIKPSINDNVIFVS